MTQDTETGKFIVEHGMCGTREYRSWQAMIRRCTDPLHTSYDNYGGRGIVVCDAWRLSFSAFYADMGKRPMGMTLDRKDVDGNYEPLNCRWATNSIQHLNQRLHHKNKSGFKGVFWDKGMSKWRSYITYQRQTTWLGSFNDLAEAVAARRRAEKEIMG